MGLRFRKSVKVAPGVKINLNKNSVSATVGTKGAHYTVNSKGKKTASVGIPGTGISYVETIDSGKKKSKKSSTSTNASMNQTTASPKAPKKNDGKKWYQKTGWIIFWLIFFFPVGLFLMWKYSSWKKPVKGIVSFLFVLGALGSCFPSTEPALEQITIDADTSEAYDINEQIYITCNVTPTDYEFTEDSFVISGGTLQYSDDSLWFSADEAGTYTVYVEESGIKSNELSITLEDKEAIAKAKAEEEARLKAEQEAKEQAEEEARLQAEKEKEEPETYTYVLNTNTRKFHVQSCSSVDEIKKSNYATFEGTREQVINKGYDPCGRCKP